MNEEIKEGPTMMVAAVASNNKGKDSKKPTPPVIIMDPRLLMAARRGDRQLLENLLVNKVGQNVSQIGSNVVIRIPEMSSGSNAATKEEGEVQLLKGTGKNNQYSDF